ncbi:LOW QUALITY PROTEIN: uncharacterized protein [Penaeus vannamei]|uniref:LOW QUALITY PROTEIN: uncharacterized protein n=1 Tax=Penaeus vannamei TaxID=6689 RepID=UPI00387F5627
MSLTAQEVVERAGVELSKCITGLGLRSAARTRTSATARKKGQAEGSSAEGSRMRSVRRGASLEKVANACCGSSVASSELVNGKAKMDKPIPPEKPSRFLLGKVRNGVPARPRAAPVCSFNGHQRSPRPCAQPVRQRTPAGASLPHVGRAPRSWDETFLARFFSYFSPIERTVLAQVCLRWRAVLYQQVTWHGVRPVLHCREMRRANVRLTTDMRRRFYVSVQKAQPDSLVLMCANDEDLMDLVANYAVNHTKALRSVALRCSSVSDKGLETLLDHLNGVYQLELQGCNDVTEAGLWACLNPRIVSLSVADCINVADEAVGAIAQLLPVALRAQPPRPITSPDAALAFFSPRQTSTLSILRLHSCRELTNHAIVDIVRPPSCYDLWDRNMDYNQGYWEGKLMCLEREGKIDDGNSYERSEEGDVDQRTDEGRGAAYVSHCFRRQGVWSREKGGLVARTLSRGQPRGVDGCVSQRELLVPTRPGEFLGSAWAVDLGHVRSTARLPVSLGHGLGGGRPQARPGGSLGSAWAADLGRVVSTARLPVSPGFTVTTQDPILNITASPQPPRSDPKHHSITALPPTTRYRCVVILMLLFGTLVCGVEVWYVFCVAVWYFGIMFSIIGVVRSSCTVSLQGVVHDDAAA